MLHLREIFGSGDAVILLPFPENREGRGIDAD